MTRIYIEYSCCPLFDMYILLPCIYVTQTKKEPSLLVKLTSLSLYVQLVDDDLVGPQREAHASDVIGQNHRVHAPVCYVMFEYPMHNFDVAHASQTGNALHHDACSPLTSSRWECVRTCSNFDMESHHDPHHTHAKMNPPFGQMPLVVGGN